VDLVVVVVSCSAVVAVEAVAGDASGTVGDASDEATTGTVVSTGVSPDGSTDGSLHAVAKRTTAIHHGPMRRLRML
jgi:hypothetical protein